MFTVRTGHEEQRVTREELEQYADLVGLSRVAKDRYCWRFVLDLMMFDQLDGIDVSMVVREIEALEAGKTDTGTKPAAMYEREPLRGLWHKHFFSAHYVAENIRIQLRKANVERIIKETLGSQESVIRTREMITELAHKMTTEQLEERERAGRLTGEWIVFAKVDGRNYYLCMGTHKTGDQVIYEGIKDVCVQQFPFLAAQVSP